MAARAAAGRHEGELQRAGSVRPEVQIPLIVFELRPLLIFLWVFAITSIFLLSMGEIPANLFKII